MNTVSLIGRLPADPELRTTTGGTPVCTVRLAINRPRKNGQDQGPVFIDVVSFNRQAEAVAEHLAKGRQVAVTGRLEYRQWECSDGSPRSRHEVVANQIDFLAKPATNGTGESPPAYAEDEEPF
ncbi:MAG TPA: single-stranded DNA-binding protein [Acidimicrobiales bacterium]|nr:single-stranded DNA-binding protein [Acidimicrobiales bacterium]